ncbi:hypothetical protein BDQ17DRAFT_1337300 [Cyathus striatus]|nr:hypothetical protein BDQ17DRAFT_1337300 [Cyathus striatus]
MPSFHDKVMDQVLTKSTQKIRSVRVKGSNKSNDNYTEDSTSKNKEGDIIMTSPPVSPPHATSKPGMVDTVDIANISPKGSSRSEGGILRGNALGNHPNATNFHSAVESTAVGPVKGQVWLYVSNADPSTVMVPGVASFTLKHNLTVTIGPVLKKLKESSSKKHNWATNFEIYLWCLTLLAAGEQSFPNITFDVFSKFIQSNFGSNITLSATLVILFSMIDNVDLLSRHARQQNAKLTGEKNVDATAWIRLLARAIQEKIGMDSDDLFDDYEINEHTTQTGRSILLGTKLDEMARLLKLYPFNQERKVFEGQLKPVSHASIDPVHIIYPIAAECET